jgi:excisionase family DNA binding protein
MTDARMAEVREVAPLLLTAEEAATALRIGRTRMYDLLGAGDVDSVFIGRKRLVPVEALREYVARLRAEAAADTAA